MGNVAAADFSTVLAEAIQARGLTLDRIRRHLEDAGVKVSVAALSYWQNGKSQPSRSDPTKVIAALEQVLELPPGTLQSVAQVTPTRRRSGNGPDPLAVPETIEEALQQMGLDRHNLRALSTHMTAVMSANRTQDSEVIRRVVQCAVGGSASFPLVVEESSAEPGAGQEIRGLSNCEPGRRLSVPEEGLAVTEMMLPRALRRGEHIMFEYLTIMPPAGSGPSPADFLALGISHPGELVLEVQFAAEAQPTRVVGYTASPSEDLTMNHSEAVELPMNNGLVQLIKPHMPPGLGVVHWQW